MFCLEICKWSQVICVEGQCERDDDLLPTAPSPTTTHLIVCIAKSSLDYWSGKVCVWLSTMSKPAIWMWVRKQISKQNECLSAPVNDRRRRDESHERASDQSATSTENVNRVELLSHAPVYVDIYLSVCLSAQSHMNQRKQRGIENRKWKRQETRSFIPVVRVVRKCVYSIGASSCFSKWSWSLRRRHSSVLAEHKQKKAMNIEEQSRRDLLESLHCIPRTEQLWSRELVSRLVWQWPVSHWIFVI